MKKFFLIMLLTSTTISATTYHCIMNDHYELTSYSGSSRFERPSKEEYEKCLDERGTNSGWRRCRPYIYEDTINNDNEFLTNKLMINYDNSTLQFLRNGVIQKGEVKYSSWGRTKKNQINSMTDYNEYSCGSMEKSTSSLFSQPDQYDDYTINRYFTSCLNKDNKAAQGQGANFLQVTFFPTNLELPFIKREINTSEFSGTALSVKRHDFHSEYGDKRSFILFPSDNALMLQITYFYADKIARKDSIRNLIRSKYSCTAR